jgi:hypothetical protein
MGQYRCFRSWRKRLPRIGRNVRDFSQDEDRDHTDSIRDGHLERLLSEPVKYVSPEMFSPD